MKLTPHFELEEFTRSDTAARYGIPNHPNAQQTANLKSLCENVLEPLRQWYGKPIRISSGYRCPQLNAHPEVKGSPNSQHMLGEAADLRIPTYSYTDSNGKYHTNQEILDQLFCWIKDHCDFDHLIKETANRRTYWIHVSCKRDPSQNRHKVTHFLLKGGGR